MANSLNIISATLLAFSCAGVASAAEGPVVIEDLSLKELREEITKVQTEFYRVFNISNADDSLDIICHKYTPTMSHITQEACEPQFLIDARALNVKNYQQRLDDLLTPEQLRADNQTGFQRLTEAMNEVMHSNDYFRELNGVLQMLRARERELTE